MIALALLLALQDPEAAFREGRYAEAVALAEKALEARKTAEMLGLLGAARLKSGDAPGAVRALEEAVAMDGATSDLHRWLGRARLEAGRHDDAIASFEAAGDVLGVAQVHVAREDWGSEIGRASCRERV